METWSDKPTSEFKIKIYLDTNILNFLLDITYPHLNEFIEKLKNSNFIDLVSSNFVILELTGVRKREHYFREAINFRNVHGEVNISSLLKYKERYKIPNFDFYSVQRDIEIKVNEDLKKIANDFEINYSSNKFHENLFSPAIEIILKTKISNQDGIVLISSVYPDDIIKENFLLLLSKDDEFTEICINADTNYKSVFSNQNLTKPLVENIQQINNHSNENSNRNLLQESANDEFVRNKILALIKLKNENRFLGTTAPCGNGPGVPEDIIGFILKEGKILKNDIYLTIIGKNLDFIYTTKIMINNFYNNTPITEYPFSSTTPQDITFKIKDKNAKDEIVPLDIAIINKLRETGNLVFSSPDSE
jgi:hypothetical protein